MAYLANTTLPQTYPAAYQAFITENSRHAYLMALCHFYYQLTCRPLGLHWPSIARQNLINEAYQLKWQFGMNHEEVFLETFDAYTQDCRGTASERRAYYSAAWHRISNSFLNACQAIMLAMTYEPESWSYYERATAACSKLVQQQVTVIDRDLDFIAGERGACITDEERLKDQVFWLLTLEIDTSIQFRLVEQVLEDGGMIAVTEELPSLGDIADTLSEQGIQNPLRLRLLKEIATDFTFGYCMANSGVMPCQYEYSLL